MKRGFISAILCASMTASALTGAAVTAPADEIETGNEEIRIGVSIWGTSDTPGSRCRQILDEAARALDIRLQYVDTGRVPEKVEESVGMLCSIGCQGIIVSSSSDAEIASAIRTCDEKGVFLAQFAGAISGESSPEVLEAAKNSGYYIGAVHEDEQENGRGLARILIDGGARDIGFICGEQGGPELSGRWEGCRACVEEWNTANPDDQVRLSEPRYAAASREGGREAAEELMGADPGLDALIPADGGDLLQGVIEAVEAAGRSGSVAIVSTGFLTDLDGRLANGSIAGESEGQYCDSLYALMMVYNAVRGSYKDFAGKVEDISVPYLFAASVEDYMEYRKCFVDRLPYTVEEIAAMSEQSLEELRAAAAALTVEGAAARSTDAPVL